MDLRGALLGCGQVSRHHLRAWSQIDGVEIVALYNRTVSKAEDRAREFGIPLEHIYGNVHDLLEHEELDFVDVATAPQIHREHVEAAAAKGIHVLCQKPLAPSIEDAHAMIEACEAASIHFSVNENWRWRKWYRDLKEVLNQGIIGRPRYVSIMKHRSATLRGRDGSDPVLFAEPHLKSLDRLIVYDWGIHLIDLLRFLFGEIVSVYAQMDHVSDLFKGEDRALLLLNLDSIMGTIDISWASIIEQPDIQNIVVTPENVLIEGDQGTIQLSEQDTIMRIITNEGIDEQLTFAGEPEEAYLGSYIAAQSHFVECLRSGKESETMARDNIKTLMATFAAYKSARKKQVVTLEY